MWNCCWKYKCNLDILIQGLKARISWLRTSRSGPRWCWKPFGESGWSYCGNCLPKAGVAGTTGIGHTVGPPSRKPTEDIMLTHTALTGRFVLVHNVWLKTISKSKRMYLGRSPLQGTNGYWMQCTWLKICGRNMGYCSPEAKALHIRDLMPCLDLTLENPDVIWHAAKNNTTSWIGLEKAITWSAQTPWLWFVKTNQYMETTTKSWWLCR